MLEGLAGFRRMMNHAEASTAVRKIVHQGAHSNHGYCGLPYQVIGYALSIEHCGNEFTLCCACLRCLIIIVFCAICNFMHYLLTTLFMLDCIFCQYNTLLCSLHMEPLVILSIEVLQVIMYL